MATLQPPARSNSVTIYPPEAALAYVKKNWEENWTLQPYLVPVSATAAVSPSTGNARFTYAYGPGIKREDRDTYETFGRLELDGWYVKITVPGARGEVDVWTGVIDDIAAQVDGSGEQAIPAGTQTLTASSLISLLDSVPLPMAWIDGGKRIERLPTFNLDDRFGTRPAGNRSKAKVGEISYVFSADAEVWTDADIIEYLVKNYPQQQPGLPAILPPKFAPLEAMVGVHKLSGYTLRQALDHLLPRRRGLVWDLRPAGDKLQIYVASVLGQPVSVGSATFPGNSERLVMLGDQENDLAIDDYQLLKSQGVKFNQLIVQGERIKSVFSLAFADSTLVEGWTTTEKNVYDAAEDDDARRQERHRRVYQRFLVPADWDGKAGNGEGADRQTALPICTDAGALDLKTPATLLRAGQSFSRCLPLKEAYAGQVEGDPVEFRQPLFIARAPGDVQAGQPPTGPWLQVDLGHEEAEISAAHARLLDGQLGFELKPQINHLYALNRLSAGAQYDRPPQIDYKTLIATVALDTDARLQVIGKFPQAPAGGRMMLINVPGAELHYVAPGTVTGIAADGATLERHAGGIVRDDSAKLRQVGALALAWYGEARSAVRIRFKNILTYEIPLCSYLVSASKSGYPDKVGTVVTQKTYDFARGELTVETGFWELDFAAMVDYPGLSSPRAAAKRIIELTGDVARLRERAGNLLDRPAVPGGSGGGPVDYVWGVAAAEIPPYSAVALGNVIGRRGGVYVYTVTEVKDNTQPERIYFNEDSTMPVGTPVKIYTADGYDRLVRTAKALPCGSLVMFKGLVATDYGLGFVVMSETVDDQGRLLVRKNPNDYYLVRVTDVGYNGSERYAKVKLIDNAGSTMGEDFMVNIPE